MPQFFLREWIFLCKFAIYTSLTKKNNSLIINIIEENK